MTRGTFNESIPWSPPSLNGTKMEPVLTNILAVQRVVAKYYATSVNIMTSRLRTADAVMIRAHAMYFLRKFTNLSLDAIGKYFMRDHASVLYSLRIVNRDIEFDYNDTRMHLSKLFSLIRPILLNSTVMEFAYICHPIGGDVEGNIQNILDIVREINLSEPNVVPFAPYLPDCMALDDNDPDERARGIKNDLALIDRGFITECRVYADRITTGMKEEIVRFYHLGVPVKPMNNPAAEALMGIEAEFKNLS